jgi:hypothetical protein
MPMGQNDSSYFISVFQDVSEIRYDQIDAEKIVPGEHQTGVNKDYVFAIAHGH